MHFLVGVIIILLIICIILIVKLNKKRKIDYTILEDYTKLENNLKDSIERLNAERSDLVEEQRDLLKDVDIQNALIKEKNNTIYDLNEKIKLAREQYNKAIYDKTEELNKYFSELKESKETELEDYYKKISSEKQLETEIIYRNSIDYYEGLENQARERADCATRASKEIVNEAFERANQAIEEAKKEEDKFNAILEPIKQYEKEKQEKLYYTIQVPDEYKNDIDFLTTKVSQQIQHPDIINKLVWSEYVKPYISETFKRANIKEESGIYKLTNIDNNKCYIGKSTNIKKRITDHIKSSIGISTIADQAVHHEIWKTGFWNWTLEPIIYCEKEKLNELEKYYINFFKSNLYGYNKTNGGEG